MTASSGSRGGAEADRAATSRPTTTATSRRRSPSPGPTSPAIGRAAVLYDATCGLCRWSAERLRRWDRRGRLRFVALDTAEADRLLPGLTPAQRRASWHLVDPAGRVVSGGGAIPPVLDLLPGGRPLATTAARFPRLTDRAYRWVAAHRRGLGRVLGQRACAVDPGRPRRTPR